MSPKRFDGFPRGTRLLPVPAPLLGSLLADIDDVAELKCTLRFLWYAAQVKGTPKLVSRATLETDDVLLPALGSQEEIRRGLGLAVARGTLLAVEGGYLLNTPDNARFQASHAIRSEADVEYVGPPERRQRPNIYALYEANIGILTPMVADQLRDAEAHYPEEWIEDAFREAVEQNKRSWRYVSAILERWATEGRGPRQRGLLTQGRVTRGEPRRHTETVTAAEYLRRRRSST